VLLQFGSARWELSSLSDVGVVAGMPYRYGGILGRVLAFLRAVFGGC